MKKILIFISMIVIGSLNTAFLQVQPAARMLIPFYIYPTYASIAPVVAANTYKNIDVILNPYNGVGAAFLASYQQGIAQLRAGNVGIYGYVYSKWGARDIAIVKAEIDQWQTWYAPDGIFIDEAANTATALSYYDELYRYISAKGMRVILNPGTSTIEAYTAAADSNCFYESDPSKVLTAPFWFTNYPSSEFCVLQYAASVEQMRSTVQWSKTHNVNFVYVTNATSHFWSSLPPYLAEEAALLAGGIVMPTVSPSVSPTRTATRIASVTPVPATSTRTVIPAPATFTPVPATSTPVVDSKCDPKYLPGVCIYLLP